MERPSISPNNLKKLSDTVISLNITFYYYMEAPSVQYIITYPYVAYPYR